MAKISSLKPTLTPVTTRKVSSVAESAGADSWGTGRGGRPWRRKREAILIRDNYTCRVCGLTTKDLEVDHIINIAQGGTDDDGNLQALCIPCHKAKTALESTAQRC